MRRSNEGRVGDALLSSKIEVLGKVLAASRCCCTGPRLGGALGEARDARDELKAIPRRRRAGGASR